MNITEVWPHETPPENNQNTWWDLMARRENTWNGFAMIERDKGLIIPNTYIHTSKGQEMVRILLFRVLEESAESILAEDASHRKEEAIDALNYLMSIPLLDPKNFSKERCIDVLIQACRTLTLSFGWSNKLTDEKLGLITKMIGGTLADTFRNRAWMQQPQDLYFAGQEVFYDVFCNVAMMLLASFDHFGDFWQFFVAKDNVLQFRLKSSY